jgi:hypothetical protein
MHRLFRFALLCVSAILLSGCLSAKSYIDSTLPQASRQDVAAIPHPQPVQLLYEFRTRGTANARATDESSSHVYAVAGESGLFSEVSKAPVADGHRLTIVIDNVPITSEDDAKAKGFGTGLTFGLVGTMVTDGYVCEATYTAPGLEPVKLKFNHALHTTIGNASGPPGLTGLSPREASMKLVDQLAWSVMRDLSKSGKL